MSIARSALVRSAALVNWNSVNFFTREDIVANLVAEWKDVETSMYGKVDKTKTDLVIKIPLTLWGAWDSASVTALFPSALLNPTNGASLFGTTDLPLTIQGRNNDRITFTSAQITKLADLYLGVDNDLFSAAVEMTCIIGTGKNPETAAAYYVIDTNAYTDTLFAKTNYARARFSGAWTGITGWSAVVPQDGFKVSWGLQLKPVRVDGLGTVDFSIDDFSASVKFIPIGPTMAQIDAQNNLAVAHGALASGITAGVPAGTAADFTMTSAFTSIVMKNAFLANSKFVFSRDKLRNGEVELMTTRGFTTGVPAAFATVA